MPKILPNVREDILQATKEILATKGYDSVNIREIAGKCDIAVGTFYHYFQSKQEVLAEMMAEEWNRMKRRIEQGMEEREQPIEKLRVIFEELRLAVTGAHTLWLEGIPAYLQECSLSMVQHLKAHLRSDVCAYVALALGQDAQQPTVEVECITRVFFSYANDPDACFDDLQIALRKLM